MLPPVVNALAAEMIRDGGSFAATFLCADSNEYWLHFGIQLDEHDGYVEARRYSKPVVVNRPAQLETQISWQHATVLLGQLRPMLRHEQHLRAADVMVDIAEHEGAITVLAKLQYPTLACPRKVLPRPEAKPPLGLNVSDRTLGVDPNEKLETSLRSVVDLLESHGE